MATALNITGVVSVGGTYTGPTTLNSPVQRINHQLGNLSVGYGTGTGQATQLHDLRYTAGAIGQSVLLSAGSSDTDIYDDALSMTQVKMIVMQNLDAAESITITGDFITAGLGTITSLPIHAGGSLTFISPNGYTVAASSDAITHARGGGSNVYWRLFIVGV